ncbi:hypothetical protein ACIOGZ_18880 [Kitasatospora sp. NPDC088160]|uniref:hypothetical protein n=1 Tax=Kitasatospora sp. NPDC088160 TaxID=3364072 RepID=UPI00382D25C9
MPLRAHLFCWRVQPIDRERAQVSRFSNPHRDEYTEVHLAAFGEPLALPAPFEFESDTKDFL